MAVGLVAAASTVTVEAQVRDTAEAAARDSARRAVLAETHQIRWYEAAAVLGGAGVLTLLDEPVQREVQRHRSRTLDRVSSVFRQPGEPLFCAGISLGVLGAGLVSGDAGVRRAGARLVTAVALSGVAMEATKILVGRSRPNEDVGAFKFHPFTTLKDSDGIEARQAMPSGHTTAAFALATSLADDIDSPVADVLLYTFAAGTGWSRINDNRHWLTDTAIGAVFGITTAKLVSGRWRIFTLRPPGFLVTPTGAPAVSWTVPLPRGF